MTEPAKTSGAPVGETRLALVVDEVERAGHEVVESLITAARQARLLEGAARSVVPEMSLKNAQRILANAMIDEAIRATGGNVRQAAKVLGLTRQALYRRLEKRGVDLGPMREAPRPLKGGSEEGR